MNRGVGYCKNTNCLDFNKGCFLLNHGEVFYCPACRQVGHLKIEKGFFEGEPTAFNECRVEFDYDAITEEFRQIAIVRDESLRRGSSYTLQSPLIKTEIRALKVAEALLANANRFGLSDDGGIPRTTETLLSFDDSKEEFSARLAKLAEELENSNLAQR